MLRAIKRIYNWIKPFLDKINHDNIFAIAGQSAFFLLLSGVPLTMFAVSVFQSLHIPVETLSNVFSLVLNEEATKYASQFLNAMYDNVTGISIVTMIVTLWSAAKGIQAITNGLNRVHNTYENRSWLVLRLRSMLYTMIFILILLATIIVVVLGSTLRSFLAQYIPVLPWFVSLLYHLRYVLVFVYMVLMFAALYRNVPNLDRETRKQTKFIYQLPGAFLCAVSWLVLSLGISIYVDDFNGFSIYGGLTRLAVIMVWLYFCLVCLMLGAEINHFYRVQISGFFLKHSRKKKKQK